MKGVLVGAQADVSYWFYMQLRSKILFVFIISHFKYLTPTKSFCYMIQLLAGSLIHVAKHSVYHKYFAVPPEVFCLWIHTYHVCNILHM